MKAIDIAKQCIAANEKGHCVSYPSDAKALYEVSKALESAERERDELRERLSLVREQRDAELNKNTQLEAEIARRAAAVCEPAFYIAASDVDNLKRAHVVEAAISKVIRFDEIPAYTAAPPAVLPPQMEPDNTHEIEVLQGVPLDLMRRCIASDAYNQCRADAIKLGAQPQKVVDFSKCRTLWYEHDDLSADIECASWTDVLAALDAANVKWEVKK